MGMFDEITCKYPLPVEGANAMLFQTKDTEPQFIDQFEIRKDGSLWHELYDFEDHSDGAKWKAQNPGKELPEGIDEFCGCMSRVNKRWEQVQFHGAIRFYDIPHPGEWLEFCALYDSGKLLNIKLVEHLKKS
jgi:hypothetical protein